MRHVNDRTAPAPFLEWFDTRVAHPPADSKARAQAEDLCHTLEGRDS